MAVSLLSLSSKNRPQRDLHIMAALCVGFIYSVRNSRFLSCKEARKHECFKKFYYRETGQNKLWRLIIETQPGDQRVFHIYT